MPAELRAAQLRAKLRSKETGLPPSAALLGLAAVGLAVGLAASRRGPKPPTMV